VAFDSCYRLDGDFLHFLFSSSKNKKG